MAGGVFEDAGVVPGALERAPKVPHASSVPANEENFFNTFSCIIGEK